MASGRVIGIIRIEPNESNAYGRYGDQVQLIERRSSGGRVAIEAVSLATGHRGWLSAEKPKVQLAPGEFLVDGYTQPISLMDGADRAGLFVDTGRKVRISLVNYRVWRLR
jgi:hypothetical protein